MSQIFSLGACSSRWLKTITRQFWAEKLKLRLSNMTSIQKTIIKLKKKFVKISNKNCLNHISCGECQSKNKFRLDLSKYYTLSA